ncbi:MAG TPA: FIST N-terminal domain-containing protein, partial [Minicystis sp.]|nr:FIST N-terminal domain-containing protein [Minicystis sp.]
MATRASVALSREIDSRRAGAEAVGRACDGVRPARPSLVLLYATVRHDPAALAAGAKAAAGGARVVGCSSQGVAVAGAFQETGAVAAAMAIASDELAFDAVLVRGVGG